MRQQYVQTDFVTDRKKDKKICADDLINRMTIARYATKPCRPQDNTDVIYRLIALSLRSREVTVEIWRRMKEFDQKRNEHQA